MSTEDTHAEIVRPKPANRRHSDPLWLKWGLIAFALITITILVIIPVAQVFSAALSNGVADYFRNLTQDADTRDSILLTLTVVPIALVANTVFGVSAAWAVTRFEFPGRLLLVALIDLPFAVSPVVAGLIFVLIFGLHGYFGEFLRDDGYAIFPYVVSTVVTLMVLVPVAVFRRTGAIARRAQWPLYVIAGLALGFSLVFVQKQLGIWPQHKSLKIIFATPGLVLATVFVTFPFVARELIPLMNALGTDEELAAVSLGASGWQMFWHVTVPNIKWGLIHGIILCNARAMGEFGAVYVVSGHIAGQTDTMPLRIEKLFQEYNIPGSFAVASLLTLVAVLTLVIKAFLERKIAAPSAGKGAP